VALLNHSAASNQLIWKHGTNSQVKITSKIGLSGNQEELTILPFKKQKKKKILQRTLGERSQKEKGKLPI